MKHQEQVRDKIVGIITKQFPVFVESNIDMSQDVDLINSGYIDSFQFLELISAIEDSMGISINFSDYDPKQFSTIGGLVRALISQ